MVQRAPRAGEVEREALERKRGRVALDERRIRRRALSRGVEQLGDEIDPDDLTDERRQRERQRACTGADVQRTLVPPEGRDERAQLLAHLLDLLTRVRGDALGRCGEAGADGVVVRHPPTTSRRARRGSELIPVTSS